MMGYYGNMFGWGGGIFMLIFWVALILFIVWAVKEIGGSRESRKESDAALEILKQRYAKGEISREEFEAKKSDLNKN